MVVGESWYHHSISRREAEAKLYNSEKNGAFLVRKSDTVPGAYVLSLNMDKFIHHYRIRLNANGFFVTDCKTNINSMNFESLSAVIKYLIANPKVAMAGPLLYPISPDIEEEEVLSSTEEEDLSDEDDDEQDETIRSCPVDLRFSLKKRASPYPLGNQTMKMFQDVFNSLETDHIKESEPEFITLLQRYVENSAMWDIENDGGGVSCLQRLIDYSSRGLLAQLRVFNSKMELLDKLVTGIAKSSQLESRLCEDAQPTKEESLDKVESALVACSQVSGNVQTKIENVFKHLSRSIRVSEECLINEAKTFEAKEGLRGKIQINVDPRKGTLNLGKSGTEYFHTQIKRLDKNYKDPNKMTIIFMDNKKRDIIFDDTRTREEFFQTVSQIKHIHKSDSEVKSLSVFTCTWNMGEVEPVGDILNLFDQVGPDIRGFSDQQNPNMAYDIYAIGTQEANITEKDWVNNIKKALSVRNPGCQYTLIGSQSLMGIRVVVLVKSEHIHKISSIEHSSVKTGVGGMVGNKGAAAISFTFGLTNLAFVSCHLAARAERKIKRSQMYHDISRQLSLGKKSKLSTFDVPYRFHHLFWIGDLNYRLECEYSQVLEWSKNKDYNSLCFHDQLKSEQNAGMIFYDFKEAQITFPPTYRYRRGSRDDYVYIKYKPTGNILNVPSYCDRILLHSLPQQEHTQTGYFCNLQYKASDHAPVIATYSIATKHQYVPSRTADSDSEPCDDTLKIRFPIIQAKIKSQGPDRFCLKFFSSILEGTPSSKPAPRLLADYNEELSSFSRVQSLAKCDVSYWGPGDIPDLDPILPNVEYISNEYIFVQVVSHSSGECYGQGILTMMDKARQDSAQPFRIMLTLSDQVCGELRGKVSLSRFSVKENRSFLDQLVIPEWNEAGPRPLQSPSRSAVVSPGGRSTGSSSRSGQSSDGRNNQLFNEYQEY